MTAEPNATAQAPPASEEESGTDSNTNTALDAAVAASASADSETGGAITHVGEDIPSDGEDDADSHSDSHHNGNENDNENEPGDAETVQNQQGDLDLPPAGAYAMERTQTLILNTKESEDEPVVLHRPLSLSPPPERNEDQDPVVNTAAAARPSPSMNTANMNVNVNTHASSPAPALAPTSAHFSPSSTPTNTSSKKSKKTPSKKPAPLKTSSSPKTCINPATEVNSRLDTQVEVRVYPCNNSQTSKKKFTQFMVKPEGVIIQGTNRNRTAANDLGAEYASSIGRKLQRYELTDTRACQLLVTTHAKSFWVVPAPEAFSRHSGTCRLLGDRKHPVASHTLQVGDFLRVGSVGVVVIETHNGVENRILSEEKIQKIMRDTTNSSGNFLDLGETDGDNSDDSIEGKKNQPATGDSPVCYMCFDDEDTDDNPLISPCKCRGDTRYVHVGCLRKWHTAEADNQICFLSSVDATCSVCKTTFKSDFKLKDGRLVKLFKSSLEPPYVSLLVATKHEMAQRLFNTRFQLSFSSLLKPDGKNASRPLLLGRSSGSDMVLDYRTVSARHATIRFKNGEFVFTDAGSSNGSYLYLRRPVELTASQPVQFRLGRSMISMKIVNKWNRRLLRAVRRSGHSSSENASRTAGDDCSVGSNEDDVRINDGVDGTFTRNLPKRTRESIMHSLPPSGQLSQQSPQHLDLLFALAYPKKTVDGGIGRKSSAMRNKNKVEEELSRQIANVAVNDSNN